MGLLRFTALALIASATAIPTKRQESGLTYVSHKTEGNVVFSIAIPEAEEAPFDVAFQIVAPKSTGWAGLAWGGSMLANPLAVAWANGDTVTISSRLAT